MEKVVCKKVGTEYQVTVGLQKAVTLKPNKFNQLELPTNSLNRKYVACAKIDKAEKQTVIYDTLSPAKKLGPMAKREAPKYSEADAIKIKDIDAKIAKLQADRKVITAKYATKPLTQMDIMVQALAKKYNRTEAEIREDIAAAKKAKVKK